MDYFSLLITALLVLILVFLITNLKTLFLKLTNATTFLHFLRLKFIRSEYQKFSENKNNLKRTLDDLNKFQADTETRIAKTRASLNRAMFKDKKANKAAIAYVQRNIDQLERIFKLLNDYETFILLREFDKALIDEE